LLKNNGIQVVFLDEYLEQKPLEKTAYIQLFGKLLGKEKEAETKFDEVEKNYSDLKKLALTAKENQPFWRTKCMEMYGIFREEKLLLLILFPMPMQNIFLKTIQIRRL
jgi:hypothetical protein